ncbi:peptidoglycan DD-metalloendopeptidase family protein [Salinarimonas soli]|uniref:Peptidoglycan DD-metalloendopeptidase family protein n=1 Tax=Salinarimonas soli TaxID=1638099 RepID=A0A5B2VA91_9HYPH|nr:peptidoglycan DD-metalloendopeptidase family protein [Salinarimonas soli]KAA2235370.1 peptidoglycan DD-metalloendopeptidase family protein [Salinarimonas soli]
MRFRLGLECRSALPRLAMVGLVSGLAAACSTDSTRLASNPFSNPFSIGGGQASEPSATGSLPERNAVAAMPSPAVPTAPVTSQPLAAPMASAGYNQPPAAPAAVPVAPRAVAATGPAGWTPQGGSAVTVGAGDTLQALSTRYNVPAAAILQANGLSTASQLTPGRTVVIPVFNAVGAPAVASAPARQPAAPAAQPQMRLVQGARPAATPASEPKRAPEPVKAPARAEAKPAPAVKAAPVKAAQAKPEPKSEPKLKAEPKPEPRPEPKRAEAKKPEPKVAEVKKPEPKAAEPAKTVAPKTAEAPAPAPVQPKPERVASLGTPPVSSIPAQQPAPAPAPQPARPDPAQTASLPANPSTDLDFRWPARGRVISGFGNGGNEGVNISVPEGTPVRAAESGTVAYSGSELKGYGNLVLIRHDNGYVSAYAHNGELAVKRGDKVKRGQVVAKSGQSGNVNSPQLHFEIRKGSTPVDPVPYLSN